MKKKYKPEELSTGVPRHLSPERKAYLERKKKEAKEADEKARNEALK